MNQLATLPSPLIVQPRHHHILPGLLQSPYLSANTYSSSLQTILQKSDSVIVKNVKQIMYFHCSSTFSIFPSQKIFLPLLHRAWPYWFPVCFYHMPCSFLPSFAIAVHSTRRPLPILTACPLSGINSVPPTQATLALC